VKGATAIGAHEEGRLSDLARAFLAGLLAFAPELCLLHAPYANSYRRLQAGSWAPSNVTWGIDNRTCLVRLCGAGDDCRFEFRLPGADVNPYLSHAGVLAAGLAGVEAALEPPPPSEGDAYAQHAAALPGDMTDAVGRFAASEVARDAFGAAVQRHVVGLAEHERDAARRLVTDVDLERGFETA
jgi:glutamine synthetase